MTTPVSKLPAAPERLELVVNAEQVTRAIDRVALRISLALRHDNPLVICVLKGGLVFCGRLLTRLHFPLELGYLHVHRYGQGRAGGDLAWAAYPTPSPHGRVVLVVDDILDQGETLAAVRDRLTRAGAKSVLTAVLVRKQIAEAPAIEADFFGLECPDRFLVGCGMDYQDYGRNLPDIRALPDELGEPGETATAVTPLREAATDAIDHGRDG